jgi:hypothetical protein
MLYMLFFYVDLIVYFVLILRLSLQIRCFRWFKFVRSDKFVLE